MLAKLGFRPTGVTRLRWSEGRKAEAPCREFALDLAAGGAGLSGALPDGGVTTILPGCSRGGMQVQPWLERVAVSS